MTKGMTAERATDAGGIAVRARTGTGIGMTGSASIAAEAEALTGTGTGAYITVSAQLLCLHVLSKDYFAYHIMASMPG